MNKKINISFLAASISLLMIFAASATPIPLYNIYRAEDGLTYNDLALTAVVYFVGAVSALLFFGRVSNHTGRKPVIYLTFFLTFVAIGIFFNIDSATPLIIGRFLLGLACGLASSTLTSFVVDNATKLPSWIPAAIISNSAMVGLTFGAITSGTLVEFAPFPKTLCYIVILTILAICSILIILSEESIEKNKGALKSLKPKFAIPQADKRLFPIAAITFVATWSLGGFYQAFGPSITQSWLNSDSSLVVALVFSSYLVPSAFGVPLTSKFELATTQRYGILLYCCFVVGILYSLKISSVELFLATSALAGLMQGAVLTASMRSLLADISSKERTGVLSLNELGFIEKGIDDIKKLEGEIKIQRYKP